MIPLCLEAYAGDPVQDLSRQEVFQAYPLKRLEACLQDRCSGMVRLDDLQVFIEMDDPRIQAIRPHAVRMEEDLPLFCMRDMSFDPMHIYT